MQCIKNKKTEKFELDIDCSLFLQKYQIRSVNHLKYE